MPSNVLLHVEASAESRVTSKTLAGHVKSICLMRPPD